MNSRNFPPEDGEVSKIGCACGHVILDQTDDLPYKATLLPDVHCDEYWNLANLEIQSYFDAAQSGSLNEWLAARGLSFSGVSSNHGSILRRRLSSLYSMFSKDVYECESCGRLHVESEGNDFVSYSPDSRGFNKILAEGLRQGSEELMKVKGLHS